MDAVPAAMPAAYFHDESGAVRFWVQVEDGTFVGATIGKTTLHYSLRGDISGADALATYITNRALIDGVVRRRVAGGSIEPVMLREHDLPPAARP